MVDLEAAGAIAVVGRCSGVLAVQVVQKGLEVGYVHLAAALGYLWARHDLGRRWVLLLSSVCGGFSLRFGSCLHDLTDFVGSFGGFNPLELLVMLSVRAAHEAEVRYRLCRLTHFHSFRVHHHLLLLVLVCEASADRIPSLLRAHAQVVKLCLLGSHVAVVAIEGSHGSLGAAMKGSLRICDRNSSFLGCRQLLDKAMGGSSARL